MSVRDVTFRSELCINAVVPGKRPSGREADLSVRGYCGMISRRDLLFTRRRFRGSRRDRCRDPLDDPRAFHREVVRQISGNPSGWLTPQLSAHGVMRVTTRLRLRT